MSVWRGGSEGFVFVLGHEELQVFFFSFLFGLELGALEKRNAGKVWGYSYAL